MKSFLKPLEYPSCSSTNSAGFHHRVEELISAEQSDPQVLALGASSMAHRLIHVGDETCRANVSCHGALRRQPSPRSFLEGLSNLAQRGETIPVLPFLAPGTPLLQPLSRSHTPPIRSSRLTATESVFPLRCVAEAQSEQPVSRQSGGGWPVPAEQSQPCAARARRARGSMEISVPDSQD